MTLIGVTPAGSSQIKLNPGTEHTMHEDDTCYYIGFTREEFSRVGGVQSIHSSLQQACAMFAAYSMSAVGINPADFDERNEKTVPSNASSTPTHPSRRVSTNSMVNQRDSDYTDFGGNVVTDGGEVKFFIPNQDTYSDDVSISIQPHIHVHSPSLGPGDPLRRESDRVSSSGQLSLETRRGLQLFRFHSGLDVHANPVVKLRCNALDIGQDTTPSAVSPTHLEQPVTLHHAIETCPLPRLSEASEERESSPYSEDTVNYDHDYHGDSCADSPLPPPDYSQSQKDVPPSHTGGPTLKELEEGRPQFLQQPLYKTRGSHIKPLKIESDPLTSKQPPPPPRTSSYHHHHHHHHHHGGLLGPPRVYFRSMSEGILTSSDQQQQQQPPTPHKVTRTPTIYSSALSLIEQDDEVREKIPKSLSHEELSPREINHQNSVGHHHRHFLDLLRRPSVWSQASHSNHDIPVHTNHEVLHTHTHTHIHTHTHTYTHTHTEP